MKKRTIIIIVLVIVAVVAFLVWKKRKGGTGGDTPALSGSGLDKNNLDDCITAAFGDDKYASQFAAEARKIYNRYNSTPAKRKAFQDKADEKGYTFEQMAVIDGAYVKCYAKDASGSWKPRDAAHKAYFDKVVDRIKNM